MLLTSLSQRPTARAVRHSSGSGRISTGTDVTTVLGRYEQAGLEGERRLVVQPLRLPLRDELGDDHGDDVVEAVGVELVEVVEHRAGELAVRRQHRVHRDRDLVDCAHACANCSCSGPVTTETASSRSGASSAGVLDGVEHALCTVRRGSRRCGCDVRLVAGLDPHRRTNAPVVAVDASEDDDHDRDQHRRDPGPGGELR